MSRTRRDSHFDSLGSTTSTVGNSSLTPANPALTTKTFSFTGAAQQIRTWTGCAVATTTGIHVLEVKVGSGNATAICTVNINRDLDGNGAGFTCVPATPQIPDTTTGGCVFALTYIAPNFILTTDDAAFANGVTSIPASVSFKKIF